MRLLIALRAVRNRHALSANIRYNASHVPSSMAFRALTPYPSPSQRFDLTHMTAVHHFHTNSLFRAEATVTAAASSSPSPLTKHTHPQEAPESTPETDPPNFLHNTLKSADHPCTRANLSSRVVAKTPTTNAASFSTVNNPVATSRSTAAAVIVPIPDPNSPRSHFDPLGLHNGVRDALTAQGICTPTPIQKRAIPAILDKKHVVIASETGSGKTIAYLAPILTIMKNTEHPFIRRPRRPRAIVLVPTRELVMQVLGVAKSFSHTAKFSSRSAVGGPHRRSQRKLLSEQPVDLLVATPGMLEHMRDEQLIMLSDLEFVVIDEADVTLAGQGFFEDIKPFLKAVDAKPSLNPPQKAVQFVYSLATIPVSVRKLLRNRHPVDTDLVFAETPGLHRATPHDRVHVKFVRVAGDEDAKFDRAVESVMDALKQNKSGKVMLFCDRDARRAKIVEILRARHEVPVIHMSREVDRLDRWSDWKQFRDVPDVRVAVCAQSLSRGIDNVSVTTIIMTDVPMTGSEYLHRVGRIRGRGKVIVLVSNRDRAVAEALFLAHVRGDDMSQLNAPSAWRAYIDAGRDRIVTDSVVAEARKMGLASWVDERPGAVGTARGVRGASGKTRSIHGPLLTKRVHQTRGGRRPDQIGKRSRQMQAFVRSKVQHSSNAVSNRQGSKRSDPLSSKVGRDKSRALRYERRRYSDSGPYGGGKWSPIDSRDS